MRTKPKPLPITDLELSKITDVGVLRAMVSECVNEIARLRAALIEAEELYEANHG